MHALMSVNMPENAWINCSNYARVLNKPHHLKYLTGFEYVAGLKYARVLNMRWYCHNNIIIFVNNVIILDFKSAGFVHPSAPQLTNLSFFNTS